MAADHVLCLAIEKRQDTVQDRRAGDEPRPVALLKPRLVLDSAAASETVNNRSMLDRQDIDSEMPGLRDNRPSRRAPIDTNEGG
ncbi:hypothetical protein AA309_11475 [Microvirga vignae]|uniref:Uncharacterized protein n=1 Tax=Microvirga vignae TaxID=1225564 RepID=A0A0H1RD41_9HYPH|nr:hypothetical protein AA309_11475 [Microvirga vignae]